MKESYKRDSHHSYLILETEDSFQENEYTIKMITYNQIPGLLKCEIRRVNGSLSLYYDITSKQPAARLFDRHEIGYDDIKQILRGIKRGLEGASGYLLDENHFLLDPDHFYMDGQSGEVSLCYVPGRKGDFHKEFQCLAEYILRKLDHGEQDAVILGYEVYRLAMEENGNIDQVLQLAYQERSGLWAEEKEKTICKEKRKQNAKEEQESDWEKQTQRNQRRESQKRWCLRGMGAFGGLALLGGILWGSIYLQLDLTKVGGVLSILIALSAYTFSFLKNNKKSQQNKRYEHRRRKNRTEKVEREEKNKAARGYRLGEKEQIEESERGEPIIHRNVEKSEKWTEEREQFGEADRDEETELLEFEDTALLESGKIADMKRLVSREKEKAPDIYVGYSGIIVGKMRQHADLILDEEYISRIHARIERNGEEIYVTDLNSTNGTFVNGERLRANERRRLQPLDEVAFASIIYEYERKNGED